MNKFISSRNYSNPLNPVYKLASFQKVAPEIPKFIRDAIEHNDIEGSKTKKFPDRVQRDPIKVKDI